MACESQGQSVRQSIPGKDHGAKGTLHEGLGEALGTIIRQAISAESARPLGEFDFLRLPPRLS
jgi:hypothetical protein